MTHTIRVFVPVGTVRPATEDHSGSPGHRDRSEFVVGMLDNHKHNSDKLLDRLELRLSRKFADVRFIRVKKPEAGKRAPQKVIDDLSECVAVVNGIAD